MRIPGVIIYPCVLSLGTKILNQILDRMEQLLPVCVSEEDPRRTFLAQCSKRGTQLTAAIPASLADRSHCEGGFNPQAQHHTQPDQLKLEGELVHRSKARVNDHKDFQTMIPRQ